MEKVLGSLSRLTLPTKVEFIDLKVAVLDTNRRPLAPCHPAMARKLLSRGEAAVFRHRPFTIILKREVSEAQTPDLQLKIDPGSKTTGIAIINQQTGEVVFAAELHHRGEAIKARLEARGAIRRHRRQRKTRYRKARFLNRTRGKGWLPPSLESRVHNVETWTRRLQAVYPLQGISLELVRFDTQLMQNPEIEGIEYQQGELAGYEVKEYLLLRWGHQCVYGGCRDVPLEVEHVIPRSRGGSNRVSNLTLACRKHNEEKGNRTAAEYGFPEIEAQAKQPLKDLAAVNATRWRLFERLKSLGLPIETGSGGLTKFNRTKRSLPKAHWIDAACVGNSTPEKIEVEKVKPVAIKATGHNSRQMCRMDKYGFPRTAAKSARTVKGFRTGDVVQAVVSEGKKRGVYLGRVLVRASGSFCIATFNGKVDGIHHRHCRVVDRADGYAISLSR
jgi:5-methylcytosine-specific restriction endonuclease McrA